VADAGAAVVGDPVDWAGVGGWAEGCVQGLQDAEGDFAFVVGWRVGLLGGCGEGADSVAGELGDEEGEVRFPGGEDLWFLGKLVGCVGWFVRNWS